MFINYIDFFIENFIKEKNYIDENNKIVYIFLIHIDRIFDEDEKDPNKKDLILKNQLKKTISLSSDFYQVFIDDLNGEEFTICDILKFNDQIFTKCLNVKEKFTNYLFCIFSYLDYDFLIKMDELNEKNYIKNAIGTLENNSELIDLIINCILMKLKTELDISEILNNNKYSARDVISIFTAVKRYLSEIFNDNLSKMIFRLEKDNFLSTCVFNHLINNNQQNYYLNNIYVKNLIETYFENINYFTLYFREYFRGNKILTLLGLRLPGIYNILKEIKNYIKNNIKINYLQAERDIIHLNQEEEENDFENELNELKNDLKINYKNAKIEILQNNYFKKILSSENNQNNHPIQEFFDLLINDYYLLFLVEILKDIKIEYKKINDYKGLLKLMINK